MPRRISCGGTSGAVEWAMPRDNEHDPDPNVNAARIVGETSAGDDLPADLEAAWAEWSRSIQKVDERTMSLLRAAFEAGYAVGIPSSSAAELGRRGGLKGGKARAEKLTKEERAAIAKKAAEARWSKQD